MIDHVLHILIIYILIVYVYAAITAAISAIEPDKGGSIAAEVPDTAAAVLDAAGLFYF